MVNIVQVIVQILVDGISPSGTNLPQPGDSRLHGQAPALQLSVFLNNEGHLGTGSHEAHLSLQDVDQLRQLINADASNQASETSQAAVKIADRGSRVLRS